MTFRCAKINILALFGLEIVLTQITHLPVGRQVHNLGLTYQCLI